MSLRVISHRGNLRKPEKRQRDETGFLTGVYRGSSRADLKSETVSQVYNASLTFCVVPWRLERNPVDEPPLCLEVARGSFTKMNHARSQRWVAKIYLNISFCL